MRNDVYRLRPGKGVDIGHEQQGPRFAIVVQTADLEHWNTWLIVPTSASVNARRSPLRPVVDFGHGECVAMVDAMRAVDVQRRLGAWVARVGLEDMRAIDQALLFVLGLPFA